MKLFYILLGAGLVLFSGYSFAENMSDDEIEVSSIEQIYSSPVVLDSVNVEPISNPSIVQRFKNRQAELQSYRELMK